MRADAASPVRASVAIAQAGFGIVEIMAVLVVAAVAGAVIYHYAGSTAKTVEKLQEERPIAHSRLAADRATLATAQGAVRAYQAERGQWPPDKAAVLALLQGPPRFQCAGNDFEYDAATGTVGLAVADPARC